MLIARRGGAPTWSMGIMAFGFALMAATALITPFLGGKEIGLSVVAGFMFLAAFIVVRNQRLICLYGLLISAPLGLSKNFWSVPHMGGASSISIEACDLFMVLLLLFILRDFHQGRRQELRFSPILFWWGALILLGIGNVIVGPLRHVSMLEVVRMLKIYLLFFVIINEVVRVRIFGHAAAALIIGLALEGAIGIVQYVHKGSLGLQFLGEAAPEVIRAASEAAYLNFETTYRIGGLLGHPNLLGAFMALVLPLGLALMYSRIPAIAKFAIAGAVALGLAALVLTLSRSSWLSFAVAFSTLFLISFLHPRLRTRYLMTRLAVIAVVAVGLAFSYGAIYKRVTESDPGALNFRYEFMEVAWNMAKDKPIFGFGLNTFVFDLPGYTKYGGYEGITQAFGHDWPVVHNTWLLTLSEQGVVGFIFFVGLHLYILWTALRNASLFGEETTFAINLGCLSGVLAIMTDGIGSFYLRAQAPAREFWIIVALIVAVRYWQQANLGVRKRPPAQDSEAALPPQPVVSGSPA